MHARLRSDVQARAAFARTIVHFFDTARAETTAEVGKRLSATLHAHQRRADELIAIVRRTAADLLEIAFHAPESGEVLEARHHPFWVTAPPARVASRCPARRLRPVSSRGDAQSSTAATLSRGDRRRFAAERGKPALGDPTKP